MTPPKPPRPSFGEFDAPEATPRQLLDRSDFVGVSAEEAVDRMISFLLRQKDLEKITVRQKRMVLRRLLRDLSEKGKDLGSVTAEDVATYRAYLFDLVEREVVSRNYAAHIVVQWNATMRAAFGETSRPGEGLIMRGFKQTPKKVDHLTEDDFASIVLAARQKRFQNEHYQRLFLAYLELDWCCGARIGSLNNEKLRVRDVDWGKQIVLLRHMKNVDQHEVVLTDRCLRALAEWIEFLAKSKYWQGRDTPLFTGPRGALVSNQWLNRTMKQVAALAGVRKGISSHVIRKSAGTIMARENPKLAQEQLGITEKIFNRHYNQPILEDRIARVDILPGAEGKSQTPMEKLGKAYWRFQQGLISQSELDEVVELARIAKTEPKTTTCEVHAYA